MSNNKEHIIKALNPEQGSAVSITTGPVLVVAGAGSGKTKVLTHRIAYLIEEGVDPGKILALTFTNKAAEEMQQRVGALLGKTISAKARFLNRNDLPWIGTFHSLCASILRSYAEKIGYTKNFVIYNDSEQLSIIKEAIKKLGLKEDNFDAYGVREMISRAKNEMQSAEDFSLQAQNYSQKKISQIYDFYQNKLKEAHALDFDDLLILTIKLLREHSDALDELQEKFVYILVDEYQDTNAAQYNIIKLLSGKYKNIFVVGDVDQSIYSWRGADFRNILQFEIDFPDTKVIKLEENYRSTQNILDAANALISNNVMRKEKNLWTRNAQGSLVKLIKVPDEKTEASFVIDEIIRLKNEEKVSLKDIAIFYRTNAQSRVLEEFLIDAGINYQLIGAFKFFERKEIKDVLAWVKFAFNPRDFISLDRMLASIPLGLGKIEPGEVIDFLEGNQKEASAPRRQDALLRFKKMILDLRSSLENDKAGAFIEKVISQSGYRERLEKNKGEENEERIENLNELIGLAKTFDIFPPKDGVSAFIEHVALMSAQDELHDGEKISLMTLHAAKGLEYKKVFIVGMEDGILPHDRSSRNADSLEEERRLCYVGITRAREDLYLITARKRFIFGYNYSYLPSRFIYEIPEQLLDFTDLTEEEGVKTVYLDEYLDF